MYFATRLANQHRGVGKGSFGG